MIIGSVDKTAETQESFTLTSISQYDKLKSIMESYTLNNRL